MCGNSVVCTCHAMPVIGCATAVSIPAYSLDLLYLSQWWQCIIFLLIIIIILFSSASAGWHGLPCVFSSLWGGPFLLLILLSVVWQEGGR